MNFQDLLLKIKQIDECGDSNPPDAPKPGLRQGEIPLMGEKSIDECGGDMPGDMMHPPKQTDSVTMSVNMNGSGAGGIKDLMNIIKNIESGHSAHGDDDHDGSVLVGMDETQPDGGFGSTDNDKDTTTLDINAITGTGNDLASKGGEAEKVNGGGNPMGVDEALVNKLTAMYENIKGEQIEVEEGIWDTVKQGVQGAVQGAQNLGQQAVQGVKNAANTVANTTVGDAAKAIGQAGAAQARALANPGAAVAGVMKQAGDAVTNARNAVGQKVASAAGGALQAIGQGAQQLGQKVAGAAAPVAPVAGVKPGAEFGDIGTGAEFGDLPPQTTAAAPQLGQAAQAAAKKLAGQPGMMNAFESQEMSDIKKLAGL